MKIHSMVGTTWIFRPSKLRRKKYVETTWIFRSAKLHRKKVRRNDVEIRRNLPFDVSTWIRRGVPVG